MMADKKKKKLPINTTLKSREYENEPAPDTIGKALIRETWQRVPPSKRWVVLFVAVAFLALFAVWTSLPSSSKERIIDHFFNKKDSLVDAPVSKPSLPEPAREPLVDNKKEKKKLPAHAPEILLRELQDKGILKQLSDAEKYMKAGSTNSKEESLRLYAGALKKLSPAAIAQLDQQLYNRAIDQDAKGYIDDALSTYSAMFSNAISSKTRQTKEINSK